MKKLSLENCKKVNGHGPYRPAEPKSAASNGMVLYLGNLGARRGSTVP